MSAQQAHHIIPVGVMAKPLDLVQNKNGQSAVLKAYMHQVNFH